MRIGVVARLDVEEAVEIAGKIVDLLLERGVETFMDMPLVERLNKIHGKECSGKTTKVWSVTLLKWTWTWWWLLGVMEPFSELKVSSTRKKYLYWE